MGSRLLHEEPESIAELHIELHDPSLLRQKKRTAPRAPTASSAISFDMTLLSSLTGIEHTPRPDKSGTHASAIETVAATTGRAVAMQASPRRQRRVGDLIPGVPVASPTPALDVVSR